MDVGTMARMKIIKWQNMKQEKWSERLNLRFIMSYIAIWDREKNFHKLAKISEMKLDMELTPCWKSGGMLKNLKILG
jgi:hypothetical protein